MIDIQGRLFGLFWKECKTRIVVDAFPIGLCSILTQLQDGIWRVVAYLSRSLSDVERRYSQTDKKALAIVWACEQFNLYVFGKTFELATDHRPLQFIYLKVENRQLALSDGCYDY